MADSSSGLSAGLDFAAMSKQAPGLVAAVHDSIEHDGFLKAVLPGSAVSAASTTNDLGITAESIARLANRSSDFERLLAAGVREGEEAKSQTLLRLVERLAAEMGPVSDAAEWMALRSAASETLALVVDEERRAAQLPFVPLRTKASAPYDEPHQVQELVLMTLASMVRTCPVDDLSVLLPPLADLADMVSEYRPRELFSDWSPPRAGPVIPVPLEDDDGALLPGVLVCGSRNNDEAGRALTEAGGEQGGWAVPSIAPASAGYPEISDGDAVFTVRLPEHTTLASLLLEFTSAPASLNVQVYTGPVGEFAAAEAAAKAAEASSESAAAAADAGAEAASDSEEVITARFTGTADRWVAIAQDVEPADPDASGLQAVTVPMCSVRACAVRLVLRGVHERNEGGDYALRSFVLARPNGAALHTPALAVVGDIQAWLVRAAKSARDAIADQAAVTGAPATGASAARSAESQALAASAALVNASAALPAALRHAMALLGIEDPTGVQAGAEEDTAATEAAESKEDDAGAPAAAAAAAASASSGPGSSGTTAEEARRVAEATWLLPLEDAAAEADSALVLDMLRHKPEARARLVELQTSVSGAEGEEGTQEGAVASAKFDTSLSTCDASGLELSEGNRVVRSSSSDRVCLVNTPLRRGKMVVTFKNERDSSGGECSCYGIAHAPCTDTSYSRAGYMYRCFNGELYCSSTSATSNSSSRTRVHQGDTIEITVDTEARTIRYKINGTDQDECFSNIPLDKPFYPAVQFYSSNIAARLVSVVMFPTAAEMAARKKAEAEKAALGPAATNAEVTPEEELAALLGGATDAVEDDADAPPAPGSEPPEPTGLAAKYDRSRAVAVEHAAAVEALMGMTGFSWFAVAEAMRVADNNADAAAEALFDGRVNVTELNDELRAAVAEHERDMVDYRQEVSAHEEAVAAFEAYKHARLEKIRRAASDASGEEDHSRVRVRDALAILAAVDGLASVFCPADSASISAAKRVANEAATEAEAGNAAAAGASGSSSSSSASSAGPKVADAASKIPTVRDTQDAIDLEEPYCLNARGETFALLAGLLRGAMPLLRGLRIVDPSPAEDASKEAMLAGSAMQICLRCLHLVRANLERLEQAHVDPADAGISVGGSNPTLGGVRAVLADLMAPNGDSSSAAASNPPSGLVAASGAGAGGSSQAAAWLDGGYPTALQQAAVEVTEAGLGLLYGSAKERAELLADLVHRRKAGLLSPLQAELLVRCLRRFSSPTGAASLLPPSRAQLVLRLRSARERDGLVLSDMHDEEEAVSKAAEAEAAAIADDPQAANLLAALFDLVSEACMSEIDAGISAINSVPSAEADDAGGLASLVAHGEADADAEPASSGIHRLLLRQGTLLLGQFQRLLLSLVAAELAQMAQEEAARYSAAAAKVLRDRGTYATGASADAEPSTLEEARAIDELLAGSGWVPSSSLAQAPACRLLVQYSVNLCSSARAVLDIAIGHADTLAADTDVMLFRGVTRRHAAAMNMTAALRRSILVRLVAPFASSLGVVEEQPWFSTAVLPHLVLLVRRTDELSSRLVPASAAALRALHKHHGIAFEAPPTGAGWLDQDPLLQETDVDDGNADAATAEADDSTTRGSEAAAAAASSGSAEAVGVEEETKVEDDDDDDGDDDDDASKDSDAEEEGEDDAAGSSGWQAPEGQVLYKGFLTCDDERPDVWLRLRFAKNAAAVSAATALAAELASASKAKGSTRKSKSKSKKTLTDVLNGAIYTVTGYGVSRIGPRRFVVTGCASGDGRVAISVRYVSLPSDTVTGTGTPESVLLVTTSAASSYTLAGVALADSGAKTFRELRAAAAQVSSDIIAFPSKNIVSKTGNQVLGFQLRRCTEDGEFAVATAVNASEAVTPEQALLARLVTDSSSPSKHSSRKDNESKKEEDEEQASARAARASEAKAERAALGPSGRPPRHPLLAAERIMVAAAARMASIVAQGPMISFEEASLAPLLSSSAFAGGVPLALVTGGGGRADGGGTADSALTSLVPAHRLTVAIKGDPFGMPLHWPSALEYAEAGKMVPRVALMRVLDEESGMPESVIEEDSWALELCQCGSKDAAAAGNRLLAWLDAVKPEKGRATKMPKFPRVMLPALIAALKHAGGTLLRDVRETTLPAVCAAFDKGEKAAGVLKAVPVPEQLQGIWEDMLDLRKFLRNERNAFKSRDTTAGEKDGDGKKKQATEDDEEDRKKQEEEEEEALRAAAANLGGSRIVERRMRPKAPSDIKALAAATRSFALFMIAMRPARATALADGTAMADSAAAAARQSMDASAGRDSDALASRPLLRRSSSTGPSMTGLSQLQARWASSLPQPSLAPLLQRWSSMGLGSGSGGDGDSSSASGGGPSLAARFSGFGMVARLARQRSQRSAASAAAASASGAGAGTGTVGGDGADDDDEVGLGLISRSPARATAMVITQLLKTAFATPVPMLRRLLFWRLQRARARCFGMHALAELAESVNLPGPQADVLSTVRSGLTCVSELQVGSKRLRTRRAREEVEKRALLLREIAMGTGQIGELISRTAMDEAASDIDSDDSMGSDDSSTRNRRDRRDRIRARSRIVDRLREGASISEIVDILASRSSSSSSGMDSAGGADSDARATWRSRHHYLEGLEGVPSVMLDDVQLAHIRLLTRAGDLLGEAAAVGDTTRALRACWAWATDMEPRDHEFLLRVGLLPALRRASQGRGDLALASLSGFAEESVAASASGGAGGAEEDGMGVPGLLRFTSSVDATDAKTRQAAIARRAAELAGDSVEASARGEAEGIDESAIGTVDGLGLAGPGGPPPLARLGSMGRASGEYVPAPKGSHGGSWLPWRVGSVRSGLMSGNLSKRALVQHMQSAPDAWVSRGTSTFESDREEMEHAGAVGEWLSARGLSGDPAAVAAVVPTAELLTAYAAFGPASSRARDEFHGADASVADDLLLSKQLARREARRTGKSNSGSNGTKSAQLNATEGELPLVGPGCGGLAKSAIDRSLRPPRASDAGGGDAIAMAAWSIKGRSKALKGDRPIVAFGSIGSSVPAFVDKPDSFKIDALPAVWTAAETRNHFHLVRGSHEASKEGKKGKLTLRFTQPARVFVFVPNGRSGVPSWVTSKFGRASANVVRVDCAGTSRSYECYSSNDIFVPEADATAASGYAEAVLGSSELTGSPSSTSDEPSGLPFFFVVEELPRDCLTDLTKGSATSSNQILARVEPPRAPEGMLRRATGTLFKLLCATGVGGAAGLHLGAAKEVAGAAEGGSAAAAKGIQAARAGISAGVGRVPLSQTWRFSLQLQQVGFSLQREVLELAAAAMASGAAAATALNAAAGADEADADPGALTVDTVEAEAAATAQLHFLSSMANTRAARLYLATPAFLATLLACLRHGSPRVRRSVLSVFAAVATSLPVKPLEATMPRVFAEEDCKRWAAIARASKPSSAGGASADAAGQPRGAHIFLGMLLELIASPECAAIGLPPPREMGQPSGEDAADLVVRTAVTSGSFSLRGSDGASSATKLRGAGDALWASHGFGSGDAKQAIACDAVTVLRSLIGQPTEWHDAAIAVVIEAIGSGSVRFSETPAEAFDGGFVGAARLLGSLAALGGHVEVARQGGTVLVGRSGLRARVVDMPFGRQDVRVIFSDDITATPQSCDPRQLAPVPELDVPVRQVRDRASEILASLEEVLSVCDSVAPVETGHHRRESTPLWVSRLRAAVVASLSQLLQTSRVVRAALARKSLTDTLYALALKPVTRRTVPGQTKSAHGFVTPLGLRNRFSVVSGRLVESLTLEAAATAAAASDDVGKATMLAAVSSPCASPGLGEVTAAGSAAEAEPELSVEMATKLASETGLPVVVVRQAWLMLAGGLKHAFEVEAGEENDEDADASDSKDAGEGLMRLVAPSASGIAAVGKAIMKEWPQRIATGQFTGGWQLDEEDAAEVLAEGSGTPGSGAAARQLVRSLSATRSALPKDGGDETAAADATSSSLVASSVAPSSGFDLSALLPASSKLSNVATAASIHVELRPKGAVSSSAGAVVEDDSAAAGKPEDALSVTPEDAVMTAEVTYTPRRLAWDESSSDADSVWTAKCIARQVRAPTATTSSTLYLKVVSWHCSGCIRWPPMWTKSGESGWEGSKLAEVAAAGGEGSDDGSSDADEDESNDEGEEASTVQPEPAAGEHFRLEFPNAFAGTATLAHSRWDRRAREGAAEAEAGAADAGVTITMSMQSHTLPATPSDRDLIKNISGAEEQSGGRKSRKDRDRIAEQMLADTDSSGGSSSIVRDRLGLALAWNTGAPAYTLKPLVVKGGATSAVAGGKPADWTAEEYQWAISSRTQCRRAVWLCEKTGSSIFSFGMVKKSRYAQDGNYVGSDNDSWGLLNDGRRGHNGGWSNVIPGRSSSDYFPDGTLVTVTHYPDGRITVQASCHEGLEAEIGTSDDELMPAASFGGSGQRLRLVRTIPPLAFDKDKANPSDSASSSMTLDERPISQGVVIEDDWVVHGVEGRYIGGHSASPTIFLPLPTGAGDEDAVGKVSEDAKAYAPMLAAGAAPCWVAAAMLANGIPSKQIERLFSTSCAPLPIDKHAPLTEAQIAEQAAETGKPVVPGASLVSVVPLASVPTAEEGATLSVRDKSFSCSNLVTLSPPAIARDADDDSAAEADGGGSSERAKALKAARKQAAGGFAAGPGRRASVTVALNQRFANFNAVVTLADGGILAGKKKLSDSSPGLARPVVFEAIADGRVVWRSKPLRDSREAQRCEIPVFSTSALKLCVRAASANEVLDLDTVVKAKLEAPGSKPADSEGDAVPWAEVPVPDAKDGVPVEMATAVWLHPAAFGSGAATLPPGAALAVIQRDAIEGEPMPTLEAEEEAVFKAKGGSSSKAATEAGKSDKPVGRHHPFCNHASGLRALPIVRYAPLTTVSTTAAVARVEGAAAASASGAGAGGEHAPRLAAMSSGTTEEAADVAADAALGEIPRPSLRVLLLDPKTGLLVPRHVSVSLLAAVDTVYGAPLSSALALMRDAAWSCDGMAITDARSALRFIVAGAAAIAADGGTFAGIAGMGSNPSSSAPAPLSLSAAASAAALSSETSDVGPPAPLAARVTSITSAAGDGLELTPAGCLESAGGPKRLVALLRLAAANDEQFREVASGASGSEEASFEGGGTDDLASATPGGMAKQGPDGAPIGAVKALRGALRSLLLAERAQSGSSTSAGSSSASSGAGAGVLAATEQAAEAAVAGAEGSHAAKESPLLAELIHDTATAFAECARAPLSQLTESLHPHPVGVEYAGRVGDKTHSALQVTFDPRTSLTKGSMLELFLSPSMQAKDRVMALEGTVEEDKAKDGQDLSTEQLTRLLAAFESGTGDMAAIGASGGDGNGDGGGAGDGSDSDSSRGGDRRRRRRGGRRAPKKRGEKPSSSKSDKEDGPTGCSVVVAVEHATLVSGNVTKEPLWKIVLTVPGGQLWWKFTSKVKKDKEAAAAAAAAADAGAAGAAASSRGRAGTSQVPAQLVTDLVPASGRGTVAADAKSASIPRAWGFRISAQPLHGEWETEAQVAGPSLAFATWLLGFLLGSGHSLPRGSLHSQAIVNALQTCLRRREASFGAVQMRVVGLLSQLVASPGMFIRIPDLSALDSLERKVLKIAQEKVKKAISASKISKRSRHDSKAGGASMLPEALSRILELFVARRAASDAFEAAEKAKTEAATKRGAGVGVAVSVPDLAPGGGDIALAGVFGGSNGAPASEAALLMHVGKAFDVDAFDADDVISRIAEFDFKGTEVDESELREGAEMWTSIVGEDTASKPFISLRECVEKHEAEEMDSEQFAMLVAVAIVARGGDPMAGVPLDDLDATIDFHDLVWMMALMSSQGSAPDAVGSLPLLSKRIVAGMSSRGDSFLEADSSDDESVLEGSGPKIWGVPLSSFESCREYFTVSPVTKPWAEDEHDEAAPPSESAKAAAEGAGKGIGTLAFLRVVRPPGSAAVHEGRSLHVPSSEAAAEAVGRLAPTAALGKVPPTDRPIALVTPADAEAGATMFTPELLSAAVAMAVDKGAKCVLVRTDDALFLPEPPGPAPGDDDTEDEAADESTAADAAASREAAKAAHAKALARFDAASAMTAGANLSRFAVNIVAITPGVAAKLMDALKSADAGLLGDGVSAAAAGADSGGAGSSADAAGDSALAEATASGAVVAPAVPAGLSLSSMAIATKMLGRAANRRAMRGNVHRLLFGSVRSNAAGAASAAGADDVGPTDSTSAFKELVSSGGFGLAATRIVPCLPSSSKALIDRMLAINSISDTLLSGTRPPDGYFNVAWLQAYGLRRYRETSHPLTADETLKGSFTIEGCSTLSVTLHPSCSLPAGCKLVLTDAKGKKRAFEGMGPADTPSESSARTDALKRWPQRPVTMAGPTIHYDIELAVGVEASAAHHWGAAFTVSADKGLSVSKRKALLTKHETDLSFALKGLTRGWTPAMDADLAVLARQCCERVNSSGEEDGSAAGKKAGKKKATTVTPSTLDLADLCVSGSSQLLRFQSLATVPVQQLRLRMELHRIFNSMLGDTLPAFALNTSRPWTTGYKLRSLSHCIMLDVKRSVLKGWLASTVSHGSTAPRMMLNNFKETAAQTSGDKSLENGCIFMQAFECFKNTPVSAFRNMVDPSNNKVFEAKFEGEDGIDAGGVYREALTRVIESVFSDHFELLVPTPNNIASDGEGTSAFLPNSALETPRAFAMLEFLGAFMGISLRHESSLPFEFPSIVWKRLLGETPGFGDLAGFDKETANLVTTVRYCDRKMTLDGEMQAPITTEEEFAASFVGLRFTTTLLSGKVVELVPDGASVAVTLENRHKWCDLVVRTRTREFDAHIAAIRKGVAGVVPMRALALFTASEVEILVCGSAIIDIALLKKHTEYSGYSSSSDTVRLFWKVFASLTDEERSQYVRFSWGRSRLPSEGQTWTHKHTLTRASGGSSKALPHSHTCFFATDLPDYTSEEDMRWGLLTAIHYGGGLLNG